MTNTNREEWAKAQDSWEHSVDNAPRMLADSNYPTDYEQSAFLEVLAGDPYHHKTGLNLLAMLDAARATIETQGREIERYRGLLESAPPLVGVLNVEGHRSIGEAYLTAFIEAYNAWADEAREALQSPTQAPLQEGATT